MCRSIIRSRDSARECPVICSARLVLSWFYFSICTTAVVNRGSIRSYIMGALIGKATEIACAHVLCITIIGMLLIDTVKRSEAILPFSTSTH